MNVHIQQVHLPSTFNSRMFKLTRAI